MSASRRTNLLIINVVLIATLGLVALATYLVTEQKRAGKQRQVDRNIQANPRGEHGTTPLGLDLDLGLTMPDFRLEAAGGGELALADLAGKVWVADFIFTNCAGVCPQMSEMAARLQERTADLADFRIVSFSVDPERDSLGRLEEYGSHYGAEPGRWFFVRGPVAEIRRIGGEGLKLLDGDDILTHSPKCALIDRSGKVRGFYSGAGPERAPEFDRLEKDIRTLCAETE
ncbi:MAG: SCO family protein [Planctomycetes bacterium]|nr:SCO family protein [Planctomycetota bacterium]